MSLGGADGATDEATFPEELRRHREAMGLSQVAFAMKLHRVGDAEGIDANGIDGNTVSRWECGRQWPDAANRLVICKGLKATARELGLDRKPSRAARPDSGLVRGQGFRPPSTQSTIHACNATDVSALRVAVNGYGELVTRIEAGRTLSADMIGAFSQQTELLRSLDRRLGAVVLTDQMRAHLGTLEEALTFATRPATRGLIARALVGAATLAAWQALDVGTLDRAWRLYELAKRAASEAGDPMFLAHAMGEQAYVLSDAGQGALAVELVREAKGPEPNNVSSGVDRWSVEFDNVICARALRGQVMRGYRRDLQLG